MTHIEFADGTNRDVEIHESPSGDWQGLYLDGVLHSQGGEVVSTLMAMIGLKVVYSSNFLRGGSGKTTAPTLGDIEQWEHERTIDLERAASLRADANGKIAEATRIEMRYQ